MELRNSFIKMLAKKIKTVRKKIVFVYFFLFGIFFCIGQTFMCGELEKFVHHLIDIIIIKSFDV